MDDIGYVYCMSNPSFDKLIKKIGFTKNDPGIRKAQLETTGVPTPFVIEFAKKVNGYKDKEKKIHNILDKYRVSSNREFFSIELKQVKDIFDLMDGEYWVDPDDLVLSDRSCFLGKACPDRNSKKSIVRSNANIVQQKIPEKISNKIPDKIPDKIIDVDETNKIFTEAIINPSYASFVACDKIKKDISIEFLTGLCYRDTLVALCTILSGLMTGKAPCEIHKKNKKELAKILLNEYPISVLIDFIFVHFDKKYPSRLVHYKIYENFDYYKLINEQVFVPSCYLSIDDIISGLLAKRITIDVIPEDIKDQVLNEDVCYLYMIQCARDQVTLFISDKSKALFLSNKYKIGKAKNIIVKNSEYGWSTLHFINNISLVHISNEIIDEIIDAFVSTDNLKKLLQLAFSDKIMYDLKEKQYIDILEIDPKIIYPRTDPDYFAAMYLSDTIHLMSNENKKYLLQAITKHITPDNERQMINNDISKDFYEYFVQNTYIYNMGDIPNMKITEDEYYNYIINYAYEFNSIPDKSKTEKLCALHVCQYGAQGLNDIPRELVSAITNNSACALAIKHIGKIQHI